MISPELEDELQKLEEKIESILRLNKKLQEENRSLKTDLEKALHEQDQLNEKTLHAKSRVKAMISQLKSMGHDT